MDEIGFMEWAFKGVVSLVLTVGGWLWVMLFKAASKNRDDLAEHRLHVSENYAKNDSLERIHDRIDDMANDIKSLLGRAK